MEADLSKTADATVLRIDPNNRQDYVFMGSRILVVLEARHKTGLSKVCGAWRGVSIGNLDAKQSSTVVLHRGSIWTG